MILTSFTSILLAFWPLHCFANASFASPNIPPPPSLSLPVWSFASPLSHTAAIPKTVAEAKTSMNIVTYVMPLNIEPPKLWAVSLYKSTLTKAAFLDSKVGILQLLSPHQSKLVPVLGKRSGWEEGYSKREACANLDQSWRSYNECCYNPDNTNTSEEHRLLQTIDILPQCQTYVHLKLLQTVDAGDHDVAICEVFATGQWKSDQLVLLGKNDVRAAPKDSTSVLYSGQLRLEGIIQ
jgi:flavin reductase (DIM6/NTAB) family NADH-FMN oxidoreductase RutF